eukprot:gene4911-8500_t
MNTTPEKGKAKHVVYPTLWNTNYWILKLNSEEFENFIRNLLLFLTSTSLIKDSKQEFKIYNDCFLATDLVQIIQNWKQNYLDLSLKQNIIELFQFLKDIEGIQNISEEQNPFNDSEEFFMFTISFHNLNMNELFTKRMIENFIIFKKIQKIISNRETLKQFYFFFVDEVKFENKKKFKGHTNTFKGISFFEWMKNHYGLTISSYGTVLLTEIMKDMNIFQIAKENEIFEEILFSIIDEKELEIILDTHYEKEEKKQQQNEEEEIIQLKKKKKITRTHFRTGSFCKYDSDDESPFEKLKAFSHTLME